jgi:hypothetical protein
MSGSNDRLGALLTAAVPEPPGEISLPDVARRVRARRTRAWLAPLAAAVVVLLVAGAVVLLHGRNHGGAAPATHAPTPGLTHFGAGLTLSYPTTWRYVPIASGSISTILDQLGYLTNQPTVAQCHFNRQGGGCHSPVPRLGADGVLVDVDVLDDFGPIDGIDPTQVIDGFPAVVDQSFPSSVGTDDYCPVGTDQMITARIPLKASGDGSALLLTACLRGPHLSRTEAQVAQMLASARIAGSPPGGPIVRVGIRYVGGPVPGSTSGLQAGTVTLGQPNSLGAIGEVRAGSRVQFHLPPGRYRLSVSGTTVPACPPRTVQIGPGHPYTLTAVCDAP